MGYPCDMVSNRIYKLVMSSDIKKKMFLLCATEEGLRERPLPGLSQSVMW